MTAAIFVRVREKQGQRKERGTCLQSGRRRGNKKEGADNRPIKARKKGEGKARKRRHSKQGEKAGKAKREQ